MLDAVFVAIDRPDGVLAAVSERGAAPPETRSPTAVLARRFADSLGYPELPIVRATQVHGARVVTVEEKSAPGEIVDAGACDALVTRLPGVGLAIQTADCVPVLLTAPGAVGAAHAGWRGSVGNVAGAAGQALLSLSPNRAAARAWLGPSIGPCCYEVGEEVAGRFPSRFARASGGRRFFLDLAGVVRSQLEQAGIPPENVSACSSCTMCGGDRFASYRRDREKAGRMIALVARLE
ncbi:MAG TPA: peptidoglycan editing factor PgeF [Thermoanaerobaculia bacterium]